MAEFDRARVRRHKSKGPFGLVSGFPVIMAIIIVITGTQQAEERPIAMASVQETRTLVVLIVVVDDIPSF